MKMKGIVIVSAIALATVANAQAALTIDAHKPVTYHFAVTNTTDKAQTVESVRTSCACLKVQMGGSRPVATDGRAVSPLTAADATGRVPPGGVLPFDVVLNPAGMEGPVEKRVWVTLAPIGGSPGTARPTKIVTFDIAADVRLRLGFKPMDAAFGVIKRSDTGREIVAKLSGYAADGVTLGTPYTGRTGVSPVQIGDVNGQDARCPSGEVRNGQDARCPNVFDVRLAPDGKSLVVRFRDKDILPGTYSETWTIPTSDPEVPEITFPVSARVADEVAVTPQVITIGWDEPVCARMVMVRPSNPVNPVNLVKDTLRVSASPRENFTILSAETKPRKWGDVKITPRPLNGWRIDIGNIDPREVRQFSKRPFLEVKTNLPGMESFEIPLRVLQNGETR